MTIDQIDVNNHVVMFGVNSITIKDMKSGKTAGIIRDARRLSGKNRIPRQDFEACERLKKAGLNWRDVSLDRIVFHGNDMYIFIDRRILKNKEKNTLLYAFDNVNGKMDKRIESDNAILNAAKNAGFYVIEYIPYRTEDEHKYN